MTTNIHNTKFVCCDELDCGEYGKAVSVKWGEASDQPVSELAPLTMFFDTLEDAERELAAALDAVRSERGARIADAGAEVGA